MDRHGYGACGCENHTVNFRHVLRGVFINGEPTQPGMLQMLWVLPELAPIKDSSIPEALNTGGKRANYSNIWGSLWSDTQGFTH